MSAEAHRSQAGDAPLRVAVITVSSTRTEAEDESGAVIAGALTSANHRVVAREIVDDDIEAIQIAVQRQVDDDVQLVVLTGGTGVTARDVTPEAVSPMLTRDLPGFGELFRRLSYEEVGAAAMLSRALGGLIDGTVVFALPGSSKACALAVDKLILPEAQHLVHLASKEEHTERRGRGWQPALRAMEARLQRDAREPLPDSIAHVAAIRDVLEGAGERAIVELGQWRYSLWGFPDLRRPQARVLAVSPGGTVAEVVALHRFPAQVGTCVRGEGGWVVSRNTPVAEVANAITGRPPPEGGALFAVSEDAVYVEREGRVIQWDGRRQLDLGPPLQALATLILEWSTT